MYNVTYHGECVRPDFEATYTLHFDVPDDDEFYRVFTQYHCAYLPPEDKRLVIGEEPEELFDGGGLGIEVESADHDGVDITEYVKELWEEIE